MDDYEDKTRISKNAFQSSAVFLYALATLVASIRVIIRLRLQKLSWWDDGFLLLAVVLMTTCLGLLFTSIDDIYASWAVANGFIGPQTTYTEILTRAKRLHIYTTVFIVTAWTGIVAVKFSFLFFFKSLIRRIRYLEIFWWYTVVFTASSWAAGAVAEVFACPRYDERVLKCGSGKYRQGTLAITGFITAVNILSDLMIISIPFLIIPKIQILLRKKIYLGCSLCLSTVLIIATIIRMPGLEYTPNPLRPPNIDTIWLVYWQFAELCLAVLMVSATAFRTLFVQQAASSWQNPPHNKPWYSSYGGKLWKKSRSRGDGFDFRLPDIPGGTITGLRTFIDKEGKTRRGNSGEILQDIQEEGSGHREDSYDEERVHTSPRDTNGIGAPSDFMSESERKQQCHDFV